MIAATLPDLIALRIDADGNAQEITPDARPPAEPGAFDIVWLRHDKDSPRAPERLRKLGLVPHVIEALTAEETRPRATTHDKGAVVNLRGVNLNPGADPEDMVSARLWIEGHRVIGVWLRQLSAVRDLFEAVERGQAPSSPGDFVASLALRLADRAEPTVAALNERIDGLEERILDETRAVSRAEIAEIRQEAIALRRYMFPQRDALTTLQIEPLAWLTERDRSRLREAADRVTRFGEELDAIRDRAQIVQDQLADRRAEAMNANMMLLSVVAAIFLPLGLISGLLGMNVAGIPGTQTPLAFWIVCLLLVVIAVMQIILFRRMRLLRGPNG